MQSFKQHTRRVALAVVALLGVGSTAYAAGVDTNHGIDITNRASVNYSVSGVPQTVIRSSPTGNAVPGAGAGADTSFKVDKKIMFLAEEIGGAPTYTSPGLNNVVAVFRVTSNTNGAQDFQLTPSNPSTTPPVIFGNTDNANMNNLRARVSNASCTTGGPGSAPAYASETADYINQLGEDSCKYVFILADTPAAAVNGAVATVLLTVKPSVATTNGGTVESPTTAADDPAVVEAVYAESGVLDGNTARDGISFAYDQYVVGTLTVTKTAAVISDGFTTNPAFAKPIPGAIVEYTISVQNNGLDTTAATLTEIIPTNTTYVAGSTTLNGVAVSDVAGAMPYINPAAISSPSQASGVIIRGSTSTQIAVVKFRVTIN